MQKTACKLNQIIAAGGLTISVEKTKLMTLNRREQVRGKSVIDNKIIEQVNFFNYQGNFISYEKDVDIDNEVNKYFKFDVRKTCIIIRFK